MEGVDAAIHADNLSKSYGDLQVLNDLSFSVQSGEVYGLLGLNGAGKTTTMNVLTGVIQPDSGTASVGGINPMEDPLALRNAVGILPEKETPPSFLSPREYFKYTAGVRDRRYDDDVVVDWAERLGYTDKLDNEARTLSRGQQQKVMLTQAFIHNPETVFIDEPLANLDPSVQQAVKAVFREYNDAGTTLFLSTHRLEIVEELCSRVGILADGKLAVERDPSETDLSTLFTQTVNK